MVHCYVMYVIIPLPPRPEDSSTSKRRGEPLHWLNAPLFIGDGFPSTTPESMSVTIINTSPFS